MESALANTEDCCELQSPSEDEEYAEFSPVFPESPDSRPTGEIGSPSQSANIEVKWEADEEYGYDRPNELSTGSDREEEKDSHPAVLTSSCSDVSNGSWETDVKGEEMQGDDESALNGHAAEQKPPNQTGEPMNKDDGNRNSAPSHTGEPVDDGKEEQMHTEKDHVPNAERPYQCITSVKAVTTSDHFQVHQRSPTGERPYLCDTCGKNFATKLRLVRHQQTHSGEKPYQCTICGKAFSQSSSLSKHKVIHTGGTLHVCPTCGKGFVHKHLMRRHQRRHTGEKNYHCKICGKTFAFDYASKHKKIHTEEKGHQCTMCGKTFTTSHQLKRHLMVHTGEKPYQCISCGKAFADLRTLKRHQKTHSAEEPDQCNM
ncbi:zinc finger protein 892-like isoform X2 [Engraulis encrasicolus]|uniref:zinc finger protein 892-like isoform X2 n=1 Tax=Engraulis encrasicolus TaxID=184585 RepID=UPI002FD1EEE7